MKVPSACLFLLLTLGRMSVVWADDINVPGNKNSIKEAILAAQQGGGTTIHVVTDWVEPGPLIVDRPVTIIVNTGFSATITGSGTLIQTTAAGAFIQGLTFSLTGNSTVPMILLNYKATLQACTIRDNGYTSAPAGGNNGVIEICGPPAVGGKLIDNTIIISSPSIGVIRNVIFSTDSTVLDPTLIIGNDIQILAVNSWWRAVNISGGAQGYQVQSNNITFNGGPQTGIRVGDQVYSVLVNDNHLLDTSPTLSAVAIGIQLGLTSGTVSYNTIVGMTYGILLSTSTLGSHPAILNNDTWLP